MSDISLQTTTDGTDMIIAGLVAIAVAVQAARVLSRAAQPLRLELAECGEELLRDPQLPHDIRHYVEFALDEAFGSKVFYLLAYLALPLATLLLILRAGWIDVMIPDVSELSPESRVLFDRVLGLSDKVMVANNPIMHTLLMLETSIVKPIANLLQAALKGRLLQSFGELSLLYFVWNRFGAPRHGFSHGRA
jgi:hypothetical protein